MKNKGVQIFLVDILGYDVLVALGSLKPSEKERNLLP